MEKQAFGWVGTPVPVVGQGTWQLERVPRGAAVGALQRALDLGMAHVDTAEMYGSGEVEEIVGEALRGRRHEAFLVTKVLPQNASRAGVMRSCEHSLRRLQTDRLDLLLLHWPSRHPLAETVAGFEDAVRQGKARAWGVSNFDVDDLEELLRVCGPGRVACNQVLHHLQERSIEHALLPWCEARGISVVGYSPFGSGEFPGPRSAGYRALRQVGQAHGATARQVALRFLTRRPSLFTIPRSVNPLHLEENAGATSFQLTSDDVQQLEAAFPLGRPRRSLPTL